MNSRMLNRGYERTAAMEKAQLDKIKRAGYVLLTTKQNCYYSSKFPPCDKVGIFCAKLNDNYNILYVDMDSGKLLRQTGYTEEDIEAVELIIKEY